MSGLLPSDGERPSDEERDAGVRVVSLDDTDADRLLGSLSSETARNVLTSLHESPATPSEVASAVDTSLQNVRHHLDNLAEADLVQIVDTRYSVKGREMDVYAPVEDALVVCVGEEESSSLLDSLRELLGAFVLLAAGSLAVQYAFATASIGVDSPDTAPRVADSTNVAEPVFGFLPPGIAFFAGGTLVLIGLFCWAHRERLFE